MRRSPDYVYAGNPKPTRLRSPLYGGILDPLPHLSHSCSTTFDSDLSLNQFTNGLSLVKSTKENGFIRLMLSSSNTIYRFGATHEVISKFRWEDPVKVEYFRNRELGVRTKISIKNSLQSLKARN